MERPAFRELPLGAVKPRGWLRAQLRLQANGFTGALPAAWPDVGQNSGWLGGDGEDWERGPYYCDGLIPLGHVLDDLPLLTQAQRWIEWSLASQRSDGSFGPRTNRDWWPRMVMLKALTQHQEATDDPRVVPFLERYLAYLQAELPARPLEKWGQARGSENVLSALWLHARNGDARLLALCELLDRQTLDWAQFFFEQVPRERVSSFDHLTHVVNVAMAVKQPTFTWLRTGNRRYLEATYAGLANLDRFHGQPQGMFSGDEWLATRDPRQGVELCAVVELMFSLEQVIRLTGDASLADRLERVAYNALPATITADMTGRQYDQQPNQVLCSLAKRRWTHNKDESNLFGLEPNFGCCTANLHQGWPKLVRSMWMAAPEGLAAVVYGPCVVATDAIRIVVATDYPFGEDVRLEVACERPIELTLHLRVPGWCSAAEAHVNGHRHAGFEHPGFHPIRRLWRDGDVVQLSLPAEVRLAERDRGALAVNRGPLLFALRVGEEWRRLPVDRPKPFADWEVHPTTPWNYALAVDPSAPALTVARRLVGPVPWALEENSAGPVPASPVPAGTPLEPIELIPYGSARLRVAELPWTPP